MECDFFNCGHTNKLTKIGKFEFVGIHVVFNEHLVQLKHVEQTKNKLDVYVNNFVRLKIVL